MSSNHVILEAYFSGTRLKYFDIIQARLSQQSFQIEVHVE